MKERYGAAPLSLPEFQGVIKIISLSNTIPLLIEQTPYCIVIEYKSYEQGTYPYC